MTTRKERQYLIWTKLEHIALEINEVLELARNGEQIEMLRDQTGTNDILRKAWGILHQIQAAPKTDIGPDARYSVFLEAKLIDEFATELEEFLGNGPNRNDQRED